VKQLCQPDVAMRLANFQYAPMAADAANDARQEEGAL